MDEEYFISGFCRALDQTRTVTLEDGLADCDYPHCVHKDNCQIAQKMDELLKTNDDHLVREHPPLPLGGSCLAKRD